MRVKLSGDLGDAVFSLSVIKTLEGGPHDIMFVDRRPHVAPFLERESIIRPLYESCPYVRSVTVDDGPCDLDLAALHPQSWGTLVGFRRHHSWRYTLAYAQKLEAEKQGFSMAAFDQGAAWLTADPIKHDRIPIHRSPRYQNPYFPWHQIVERFGDRCAFVGLPHEHDAFQKHVGRKVDRMAFPNLYELARFAAGAEVCIGNQSSPNAVFEGLKVPRIQETCLWQPDCIYPFDGHNWYVADGGLAYGDLVIPPSASRFAELDTAVVPRGGWQYGEHREIVFDHLLRRVARDENSTPEAVRQKVYLANCERVPEFFRNRQTDNELTRYRAACESVGYKMP